MKKILLSLLMSLISLTVLSQGCLPEGITFTTQEQIDNFQTNYPGCTEIEGGVQILGDDLTNLDSLIVITSIEGYLSISATNLINLRGLDNLIFLGGDLYIDNSSLVNLEGLGSLSSINGSITIVDNDSLKSLTGLNNVVSISGNLTIGDGDSHWGGAGNPSLTNLNGLNSLTGIAGNLRIESNDSLTNLFGLDNLKTIGGDLRIGHYLNGNPFLTSLNGLENLNTISGHIQIVKNDALMSFTGLENLINFGGQLYISSNNNLISLSGLDNLSAGSIIDLYIENNITLSTCEVHSICEYLISPDGYVSIYNNSEGCNSREEVEEACASSINEISTLYGIKTQPNPFTTSTTLSYELQQPEKVALSIYNHLGQLVYQAQENQPQGNQQLKWNAERYAEGVYYYRLKVGDAVANGKMVKVR